MHVGLNLIYMVPGETGGTETYARELIPALLHAASGVRFTAFVSREAAAARENSLTALLPTVTVPVSAANRLEWVRGEQLLLPRLAVRSGVDLVHSLANTAPGWGNFRRVVTIHDLHHRVIPEAHLGMLSVGMRLLVSMAARRSDRIVSPSASTATDVEQLLKINPTKIDVIPEGVGASLRTAVPEPEIREWLGARNRQIVLSVSAKRPHKNLARLIDALAEIPKDRRPLLVVPGYSTPHENELRAQAAALDVADDVRLIGWIEPARLEGLYSSATCLVCASLHEGFGLPVLEAMCRGLPVACSTGGALSEVTGTAAILFDPRSVSEIAAAIQRLLSDPAEAERLSHAGRAQAAKFTWAATAHKTLASYEAALRVSE